MDKNNNVLDEDLLKLISQDVTITQLDCLPTQELIPVVDVNSGRYENVAPSTSEDLERRKIERLPKSTRKQNCWAMNAYEDWANWTNTQV